MHTGPRDIGCPQRIVVKIGSAVIARAGVLEAEAVGRLAADISAVMDADADRRVVVVSSGAVASGFRALGLARAPKEIVGKQAAAAVGQPRLMSAWAEAFAARPSRAGSGGRAVAQVLLTAEDIDHRTRFLNARHTLDALLRAGVVPVINENDSVSFTEIKLGDNDHLSSLVASLVGADLLVLLSSVAGVWDAEAPVRRGGPPVIVPEVRLLAEGLRHVRTDTTDVGTGGMATKIKAACTAASLGIGAVIADGGAESIVARILSGEQVGTYFPPAANARAARDRWIGFAARPKGVLRVDDGARRAVMMRGASLLASGLRAVEGTFDAGAPVELAGPDGEAFARGLSTYSAADLARVKGLKSEQIDRVLGEGHAEEVVHRDDLVLLNAAVAGRTDGAGETKGARS